MSTLAGGDRRVYRAGAVARWAGRVLAAAWLSSCLLVSGVLESPDADAIRRAVRFGVLAVGAIGSLWAVRSGAITRQVATLEGRTLFVSTPRATLELDVGSLRAVRYLGPFERGRRFVPCVDWVDREGRSVTVHAWMRGAADLALGIVERSGSTELGAWADARAIVPRLRAARRWLVATYGFSGILLGSAVALVVWVRSSA